MSLVVRNFPLRPRVRLPLGASALPLGAFLFSPFAFHSQKKTIRIIPTPSIRGRCRRSIVFSPPPARSARATQNLCHAAAAATATHRAAAATMTDLRHATDATVGNGLKVVKEGGAALGSMGPRWRRSRGHSRPRFLPLQSLSTLLRFLLPHFFLKVSPPPLFTQPTSPPVLLSCSGTVRAERSQAPSRRRPRAPLRRPRAPSRCTRGGPV
jgi:hypothetical protein